jgi:hypothetical protein
MLRDLDAGYALGLTLSAVLMLTAVVIALTVLRRPPRSPVGPSPDAVTSAAQLDSREESNR